MNRSLFIACVALGIALVHGATGEKERDHALTEKAREVLVKISPEAEIQVQGQNLEIRKEVSLQETPKRDRLGNQIGTSLELLPNPKGYLLRFTVERQPYHGPIRVIPGGKWTQKRKMLGENHFIAFAAFPVEEGKVHIWAVIRYGMETDVAELTAIYDKGISLASKKRDGVSLFDEILAANPPSAP